MVDLDRVISILEVGYDSLNKMLGRTKYNDRIAEYFEELSNEESDATKSGDYEVASKRVKHCMSTVVTERYDKHKYLGINSINLCMSRFCPNCQKMIQTTRLAKMYEPITESDKTCDLYHMVLTVVNVSEKELKQTLKDMQAAFAMLVRYFTGNAKIKGIDFSWLGFNAAVRSFEITYRKKRTVNKYTGKITEKYHPHIHCIFAFKKGLSIADESTRTIFNDYSKDRSHNKKDRLFNEFEILIQKIWYLLINNIRARNARVVAGKKRMNEIRARFGIEELSTLEAYRAGHISRAEAINPKKVKEKAERITLEKINALPIGYSCMCDPVTENTVYEVFKYAFKIASEEKSFLGYEEFKVLYKATKNMRQIQTYGGWYNIKLDDTVDIATKWALWETVREYLGKDDQAIEALHTLNDVVNYVDNGYMAISRAKIFMFIDGIPEFERIEYLNDVERFVNRYRLEQRMKRQQRFLNEFGYLPPSLGGVGKNQGNNS